MSFVPLRRPTPALAVAVMAVVLALGGTALATGGGASAAHKHKHAVSAARVHRIVARYVEHHPGPRGRRGAVGAAGTAGAMGARGPQGPAGHDGSGAVYRTFGAWQHLEAGAGHGDYAVADCPPGMVAIGGGFVTSDDTQEGQFDDAKIQVEESDSSRTQWIVFAENTGDGTGHNGGAAVQAHVVCSPGRDVTPQNLSAGHRRSNETSRR